MLKVQLGGGALVGRFFGSTTRLQSNYAILSLFGLLRRTYDRFIGVSSDLGAYLRGVSSKFHSSVDKKVRMNLSRS